MKFAACMSCMSAALLLTPALHAQTSEMVFNVGTIPESGGSWVGAGNVAYDDVTFGPGTGAMNLSEFSIALMGPPQWARTHLYARITLYPDHNNAAPGDATPYAGTPIVIPVDLGVLRAGAPPIVPTTIDFAGGLLGVRLDNSNVFTAGPLDRTMGLKIELFRDAAFTQRPTDWQIAGRGSFTAPFPLGSSDAYAWSNLSTTDGALTNAQRTGSESDARATYLVLFAEPACGPQDFNGDGDSGTDQDIEAFFACLGGNCCPECWPGGADFNMDGDTGTDQDIEAFFRVLGGGGC